MMEKLRQERLEVSIKCQANAEEAFKEALAYAKTREAFGRPIGNFQYAAFRLAEMATEVQMGRTFLDDPIAKHIRGESIVQEVSMAKYWLGEVERAWMETQPIGRVCLSFDLSCRSNSPSCRTRKSFA